MKKRKSLLVPAMCILLSLSLCSCKPHTLDEAKGRVVTEASTDESDSQKCVYENDLFGFGVNLEGFTQIKDMDQLLAIDPQNTAGYEERKSGVRIDDLNATDDTYSKSINLIYLKLNRNTFNKDEKNALTNYEAERCKQLEINGYKIMSSEISQIPFCGEDHYAMQITCFKSGVEMKETMFRIRKDNIEAVIQLNTQNNENGMDEILNAFYSYSSIQ